MRILDELEPKSVFHFFEDLCQIPHPSYKEKAISDYLVQFAKDRNLEVYQDDIYNVIMIKEATPGYEDQEPIILQGHMDMVCEKNPGVEKDMDKEGLDLEIRDGYVWAKGTTLGGDDGIAVAYALALLDSDTLQHPRLEFVCTVSEEVGMDGAHAIDVSPLKGHTLLNMDSETEGSVLAGCAGGGTMHATLPIQREGCDWDRVMVHIHGLAGGHSGADIHLGKATSKELMGRTLRKAYYTTDIRLVSFENGSKDNALSREGFVVLAVKDVEAFNQAITSLEKEVQEEYASVDPNIQFSIEEPEVVAGVATTLDPLDLMSTCKVISLLTSLPQGIQRMSHDVEGLVETSLNWGVATLSIRNLKMKASLRSSVTTAFNALVEEVSWIVQSYGANCELKGKYPAWQWVKESKLRDKMSSIYKEMFGKDLVIEAIHAGVECGLLAEKIPNMDAISMGPNIIDIHTPNEHLDIASTQRMWDFIVRIIETKD